MSYTPTEWNNGDVITAEKLNKLENGVAAGGSGGGVLVVNITESDGVYTTDKTAGEIKAAFESGTPVVIPSSHTVPEAGYTVPFLIYVNADAGSEPSGDYWAVFFYGEQAEAYYNLLLSEYVFSTGSSLELTAETDDDYLSGDDK